MEQIFVKNLLLGGTHGIYSLGEYADIKLINKDTDIYLQIAGSALKKKEKQRTVDDVGYNLEWRGRYGHRRSLLDMTGWAQGKSEFP